MYRHLYWYPKVPLNAPSILTRPTTVVDGVHLPKNPEKYSPLSTPLLPLTPSSMLVLPHPESTIDSDTDREGISQKDLWPRVIGTSLTTHSRVLEKGKVWETESDGATCPNVAEGKFAFGLNMVNSQVHRGMVAFGLQYGQDGRLQWKVQWAAA